MEKYILNSQPLNRFYVYILINPFTNKPFYIGKGSKNRYAQHFKLLNSSKSHKINTIKKIINNGKSVIIEIPFSSDDENRCFECEKNLIKKFGRVDNNTGILTNLTNGGEGSTGIIHSKETIEKISKTRNQKILSGKLIPHKHTQEHKNSLKKVNPGGIKTSKRVYQICSKTGNIIKIWPSSRKAGMTLGIKSWRNISSSANNFKHRIVGGYYWRWYNSKDVKNGKLININSINCERIKPKNGKMVQQISENDEIIKTWSSISGIIKEYQVSRWFITKAISKREKYLGYFWKYS